VGLIVIFSTLSIFPQYPSIPTIAGLLPLMEIVTGCGLIIEYPKGNDANPLTHHKVLSTGISGPQLLSQYAELPNAVDIITPVP
jgi:hypothetical protein